MPEPQYDFGRIYNLSRGRDAATTQTAIQGLEANPDDAARAVQLGTATGVPPSLVDMNLEKFERDQKTGIVSGILRSDKALRDLVERDPMFAKVTSDDWAQTARVSAAARKHMMGGLPDIGFTTNVDIAQPTYNLVHGFMENYQEAAGTGQQKITEEYERATPYLRAINPLYPARFKMDFLGALFHGALGGVNKAFGREAAAFLEWRMMDVAAHVKLPEPSQMQAAGIRVNEAYKKAEPYLRAGKSIPDGLDPLLDQMKGAQAHWDAAGIDAILDEAEKSLVKERSPEMMVKLIQQHVGDRLVGLPYDAVEKLYGTKVPQPGDGLFGDIPGFMQKYNDAVLTGGDILVPMAEYVGRITPEARKAMAEFYKPTPGGMTLFEAKARLQEPVDLAEPVQPAKTLVESVKDSIGQDALLPEQIYAGLDQRTKERFIQLADRDRLEDTAWNIRKAAEEISKTKTKQWMEESALMRPDVALEVSNRPEWVAYDWFKDGVLRGVSGERPKLDPMRMTPEQRKAFPKEYMEKNGADPDVIAREAGFKTGDDMINVMSRFDKEKGELGPTEFLEKIVEDEVNRRMEAEYGRLPDQILSAAQDHILGKQTTSDRAWQNTVGIALHAGQEPPYTKKAMEQAVKNTVANRVIGELSRETFISDAYKAANNMAKAFLKGDFVEALKQAQRHHAAVLAGKEVARVLREKEIFEKQMDRFKKREVAAFMNPFGYPYFPRIQSIMVRIGRRVEHTPQTLTDALGQGDYAGMSLKDFVDQKHGELRDIDVPDFLFNEGWEKPVEKMSVGEWRQVRDALNDLVENGRNEATIYREGKAYDLAQELERGIEKIKLRGIKKLPPRARAKAAWFKMKEAGVEHLNVESILNRIEEDDPSGFHNQFVMRTLVEADNYKQRLTRYYDQALAKAAGSIKDIDKPVENSLWINPVTREPLDLRKRDVLGILQYWGSPSSRQKLLEGYGVGEEAAYRWLLERTTKEDWDRAQQMGHIFSRLIKLADKMRMEISGSPIKKIDILPIDTPHGRYEGWYNPIDHSPYFPTKAGVLTGEKLLEGEGFKRATTPQTYTKERTGKIAPVDLSLDAIPVTMRQMIHDIAFRPAILQVSKVFYNPEWRGAMINYMGPHYERQFIPYLKDVANYSNHVGDIQELVLEKLRQNLISTYIGLNPHTVAKHGMTAAFNSMREVGTGNFLGAFKDTLRPGSEGWKFAMETSGELQKRMRSWVDFMGFKPEIALRSKSVRETMAGIGAMPVAFFDLYSAVPTWLAKYREVMGRGLDEGQAIFEADRSVRRAHGSSAITNLPKVMRTNSMGRMYTSLYGFFSHMLQKQYEIAWKAHDSYTGVRAGDYSKLDKYKGDIALGIVSYIIIPAVVEELVTPYMDHEKDSWGKKAGKALYLTGGSSVPYLRDFIRATVNHIEPTVGLLQSAFHEAYKLQRDLTKGKFDHKTVTNLIKESFTMAGIASGYTNAQEGRTAAFAWRWSQGLERPKGLWEILHGLTKGTIEEPRHRRR